MAKSTKTPYYRIEMCNSGGKLAIADDAYIGRLRSNPGHTSFYLYDAGVKESEVKMGIPQSLRR